MREATVRSREIDTGTLAIEYAATVVVPAFTPDNLTVTMDVQVGESESTIPPTVTEIFSENPALKAAVEKAGPMTIWVDAVLPGDILVTELDGVEGDYRFGDNIAEWSFRTDRPGTYHVRAISRWVVGTGSEVSTLNALAAGSSLIDDFHRLAQPGADQQRGVLATTQTMTAEFLNALPPGTSPARQVIIGRSVWLSTYLASFEYLDGEVAMPALRASLPVVLKLAQKAAVDDSALRALERLVALLAEQDMRPWRRD